MPSPPVHLPEELVVKILCRLPSKSLLRFRCVCKSWYSLITDPSFISLHRRHSPSFLLLQLVKTEFSEPRNNLRPILHFFRHDENGESNSSSSSSFLPPSCNVIVSICDGLLCVSANYGCSSLFICNPSIRRFFAVPELPEPQFELPPDSDAAYVDYFDSIALGFDSRNQDYKIVRIAWPRNFTGVPMAEIFSLASGSWRHLPPPVSYISLFGKMGSGIHGFVNGVVHWCIERRMKDEYEDEYEDEDEDEEEGCFFILSFDFENEVFGEVAMPEGIASTFTIYSPFAACANVAGGNGKDLTVCHSSEEQFDGSFSCGISVMKEYGIVESWTQVFHFDITRKFCFEAPAFGMSIADAWVRLTFLCVVHNGEILLPIKVLEDHWFGKGCFYLLDLERRRLVNIPVEEGANTSYDYLHAGSYLNSLALLNNVGIDGFQCY